MKCEHKVFKANANVNRLTNIDGKVDGYTADIKIECLVCSHPFKFKGMPFGSLIDRPAMSFDRLEARIPIEE